MKSGRISLTECLDIELKSVYSSMFSAWSLIVYNVTNFHNGILYQQFQFALYKQSPGLDWWWRNSLNNEYEPRFEVRGSFLPLWFFYVTLDGNVYSIVKSGFHWLQQCVFLLWCVWWFYFSILLSCDTKKWRQSCDRIKNITRKIQTLFIFVLSNFLVWTESLLS